MRVAVVGATGNVGTALLRRIHEANAERRRPVEVVGIARRLPEPVGPYADVEWRSIDVAAPDAPTLLREALAGCDAVVHLAWVLQPNHDEPQMRRINVDGTRAALEAAVDAGVGHFVCASSVGAYSRGPGKERRVDESWPARGIATSHYSRFKGQQEALLDSFAESHPDLVVARMRPGLIFQAEAGSEIARYFIGPWIPTGFLDRFPPPVLPFPPGFLFQALHADDVADAYWRCIELRAAGAFNVAAEPVLTPALVGGVLGARRWLAVPVPLARAAVAAAWRLRLLASDPGWVDMAAGAPILNCSRARTELGWTPRHSSTEALRTIIEAIAQGPGRDSSPPLLPRWRQRSWHQARRGEVRDANRPAATSHAS